MSKEKILLFLLAAVQFTHIVDFMIIMPLGPQLMRLMEISPKQFGLLVSSYTFSAGVVGFLFAFVADRFDRKQALLFAYVCFVVGTFSCGFANSYTFLLAARIFTGFFGGVMNALIYSIVADNFPYERRASAMGVVMAWRGAEQHDALTAFAFGWAENLVQAAVRAVPFGQTASQSSWR